jgi:hypothetical protein
MGSEPGQLAFVEKNKDSKVTFLLNKKQRIVKSTTEFSENLSGGIIVLDPDKKSGETGYREKRDTKIIQSSLATNVNYYNDFGWRCMFSYQRQYHPFIVAAIFRFFLSQRQLELPLRFFLFCMSLRFTPGLSIRSAGLALGLTVIRYCHLMPQGFLEILTLLTQE